MTKLSYAGYRFPPEIIRQAIWLYLRFTLSLRDVEDLLAERGVAVSYETVRRWVNHFGPIIAAEQSSPPAPPTRCKALWPMCLTPSYRCAAARASSPTRRTPL